MNVRKLVVTASVLVVAGSSFAGDNAGGKTRGEVLAELQQAQAEGTYVVGGAPFVNQSIATPTRPATQSKTTGSDKSAAAPAVNPAGKTRAEVIAELKQAQADGSYVIGGSEFAFPEPVMTHRTRNHDESMQAQSKKPSGSASGD